MNKLAIIYNICGISGNDNSDHYIKAIYTILNQRVDGKILYDNQEFKIVVSGCMTPQHQKNKLIREFGNLLSYCWIDSIYTINITFNKSVRETVNKFGEFEGYLYVDSGCLMEDTSTIDVMYQQLKTKRYGMVTIQASNDNAFAWCFGQDTIYEPKIVQIGKACNVHVHMYSNEIYLSFSQRLLPDIFASYCTESIFSFINASIQLYWLVIDKPVVLHAHSMDGASIGFQGNRGWSHVLSGAKDMNSVINDEEGTACGMGYEECCNIKMHNKNAYDTFGRALYPDRLRKFIYDNFYLNNSILDYDTLNHTYE